MAGPVPYLYLPGTAREALITYQKVFGGELQLSTYQEFQRTDGPGEAIAHGELGGGPVQLFAADAVEGDPSLSMTGLHFALLGTADPGTMRGWFEQLSAGGRVVDPLQVRLWGDSDGQVVDRFGVHWLIGYQG